MLRSWKVVECNSLSLQNRLNELSNSGYEIFSVLVKEKPKNAFSEHLIIVCYKDLKKKTQKKAKGNE